MFVGVLGSTFIVGVLFPGFIAESFPFDMSIDFAVVEVTLEVGVLEGVVVGEGYFVDVVGVDELFLRTHVAS